MEKERANIDASKTLPSQYDKEFWEIFAKLILEKYYPNKFFNLSVDGEKPDLRNNETNIGIEVTSAEKEESREMNSLYCQQYLYGDNVQKGKALRRIEQLGGEVKDFCLMYPVTDRNLEEIYLAVKEKTVKLNKNYKIFKENYLFIFDAILILDQELPEILKRITENSVGYISFDTVFLYCLGGDLYEFNLLKKTYRHHEKSDKTVQQLAINARLTIEERIFIGNKDPVKTGKKKDEN